MRALFSIFDQEGLMNDIIESETFVKERGHWLITESLSDMQARTQRKVVKEFIQFCP